MKILPILILVLLSGKLQSQLQGVVLNKETNAPIQYANIWIEDEDIGTTSDENGHFTFNQYLINKSLIISAIGYERTKFQVDSSFIKVHLPPKSYIIPGVSIKPKTSKTIVIGYFEQSEVITWIGPTTPQIFARLFTYELKFGNNPSIKRIRFSTSSQNLSTINLRIFKVRENGEPGEDILPRNFIVKIDKGKRINSIDLENSMNIPFPKEGVFIGFEQLIIEENKYLINYSRMIDSTKHLITNMGEVYGYLPGIGVIKSKLPNSSWTYRKGKWRKDEMKLVAAKKRIFHYLAIELTLNK